MKKSILSKEVISSYAIKLISPLLFSSIIILIFISSCKKSSPTPTPVPPQTLNGQWIKTSFDYNDYGVVHALLKVGNNILAGADGGVIISSDSGLTWNDSSTDIINGCWALANKGSTLYAGDADRMMMSTNNGNSWTDIGTGLPHGDALTCIFIKGNDIYVGFVGKGIYCSSNGSVWIAKNTGLSSLEIVKIVSQGNYLFTATTGGGVFRSDDNGNSWIAVNSGIIGDDVDHLAVIGSNLFAQTVYGVYKSTNNGVNWNSVFDPMVAFGDISTLITNGTDLYGCSGDGFPIYLTKDYGASWIKTTTAPQFTPGSTGAMDVILFNQYLFIGTNIQGIWKYGPI